MHTNFDKRSEICISQPNTVFSRISSPALIVSGANPELFFKIPENKI